MYCGVPSCWGFDIFITLFQLLGTTRMINSGHLRMENRRIVAVAFIGKQNEPLYFFSDEDYSEILHLQMITHSSLDIVEEKRKRSSGSVAGEMYLGHLISIDDYKTFGFYSNTHTKTIIACEAALNEAAVREVIIQLNALYVNAIQNPFQEAGMPLTSRKFNHTIQQLIQRFNSSTASRK